jgi:hypothetical protein
VPAQAYYGKTLLLHRTYYTQNTCIPRKRLQNNSMQTDTVKSPLQFHMLTPFFFKSISLFFSSETKRSIEICAVHVSVYCHQGEFLTPQSTIMFTITFPNVKTLKLVYLLPSNTTCIILKTNLGYTFRPCGGHHQASTI